MAKKCEFCSGNFANADSLRRHQQKYHRELMEKDEDEENKVIAKILLKAMHVMGVSYTVSQIKDNYDDVYKAFKDQVFSASSLTLAVYDLPTKYQDSFIHT